MKSVVLHHAALVAALVMPMAGCGQDTWAAQAAHARATRATTWTRAPPGVVAVPAEQVAPLLAAAARLSGLPPLLPGHEPRVWSVSQAQMRAIACRDEDPAHCNGLQAIYDDQANRILVLEWGRQRGTEWESFVVHEYVHALQYAQRGSAIYADCPTQRATEQQAYGVQDRYLKQHGALLRVDARLRWWHCAGARGAAAAMRH